ncbi:MAG: helix-turn-helix transcriptional regulator [Bdellovibrionales bacterium]|nr:helix-turn-helix transcriptional regulator [Bdellovibrionales bacterium]
MPKDNISKKQQDIKKIIANNIRTSRESQGWSQEEAAHRVNVHFRHYQKIEYGKVNVTIDTLVKVCKGFGINIQDLFKAK